MRTRKTEKEYLSLQDERDSNIHVHLMILNQCLSKVCFKMEERLKEYIPTLLKNNCMHFYGF